MKRIIIEIPDDDNTVHNFTFLVNQMFDLTRLDGKRQSDDLRQSWDKFKELLKLPQFDCIRSNVDAFEKSMEDNAFRYNQEMGEIVNRNVFIGFNRKIQHAQWELRQDGSTGESIIKTKDGES